MIDLTTNISGVSFSNPVFVASGTFGYGTELPEVNVSALGAIITKSVTRYPREGNPPPRIVESASGMINSIGLANVGIEECIRTMFPRFDHLGTKVILNVAGSTIEEYLSVVNLVERVSSSIVGYEINISCPNVKQGGMEFGVDHDLTARLTAALREKTERLLIMKLSPNVTDIVSIAKAAENAGADALSAINTIVGMSIDSDSWRSNIYTTYGGLSGSAIKPVGLAAVHKIFRKVRIPVIGIGGIVDVKDTVEYLLAGATAIEVGSANFRNPHTAPQIVPELINYLREKKLKSVKDLIGKVIINS
ncbi:MAG: dihydroorotate dehydrogenase [Fidelibacterota bacterium]